ncbi:hypothetical protein AYM40_07365 [Paraburkholderia phytofirmans OLGA172]|uniref:Nucleoside 2-deoxyribosyltransferase n=1 Tax=Paraburkholderia phytofirmans OLGA172 TaxID=1417228 RepID=A0A161I6E5_9BURK|nr:DUF4406 domain-containing protein [Paraburkholderia phytofirmans]ANB72203.1 hypothetical protein AYM40_07365 [Paraburkholderia phytofirmans OLGA172]
MKLYLAGPMTGLSKLNLRAFHEEAARLRAMGYEIANPVEFNVDRNAGWQACMRVDIPELVKCDGVRMLGDWESSPDATLERHIAMKLGMKVEYARQMMV